MKISSFILVSFSVIITSCYTSKHNQHVSLTGANYEPAKGLTSFTHLGDYACNVDLPGKWKYIGFDQQARDYVLKDSMNQSLFIFKGGRGTASFNKSNLDGDAFIELFYTWDAEWYLANYPALNATIIEKNPGRYLVAQYADSAYVMTSLYGTKNGNGVRISIRSKSRVTQTDFVKAAYENLR